MSSPERRVPWAQTPVPGDGAGLTCAPSPQTTRCRISPAWASQPPSCCSSGSCSARLGMTAEEPETRPELSTGTRHHLEHCSLGRELPAPELREEPLTPGGETRRGAGGGGLGARPLLTGAPPSQGGRPDSYLCSPAARGASHMAGVGPHPARLQALSTLMKDVSLVFNAHRLRCEQ